MLSYDTPVAAATAQQAVQQAARQAAPSIASPSVINTAPLSATSTSSNHLTSSNQATTSTMSGPRRHIWVVAGSAGCGKSTVAIHLSKQLNVPYVEGDDFHPPANIAKMSTGTPLTDEDRWDWLTILREEAIRQLDAGNEGVVMTCSALKRKYRDVIRVAPYYKHGVDIHIIFLHAAEEILLARVGARKDHYMGANMVHSQLSILEPPGDDEVDVITIDVGPPAEVVLSNTMARVQEVLAREAQES